MREDMNFEEYQGWLKYYSQRPEGWKDDMRAYKIMISSGAKVSQENAFPSLAIIKAELGKVESKATDTLKGSTIFSKMLGAVGGDTPAFLGDL